MTSPREEDERVSDVSGLGSLTAGSGGLDDERVRGPRRALTLALALFVGGCSLFQKYKASDIERAPSFSAPALVQQGVVIGTVACARPERLVRETSTEELASSLQTRLLKRRPELKVLTPDSVELALGAEKYEEWTKSFQDTGLVRTEYFPEILSKLQDSVRYILVARVERDQVSTSNEKNEALVNGSFVKGEKYVTTRQTEMLFRLYDLETGTMEWKGHADTINERSQVGPSKDKVTKTLDLVFPDAQDASYPEPTSIQTQTGEIFKAFVKALFETE